MSVLGKIGLSVKGIRILVLAGLALSLSGCLTTGDISPSLQFDANDPEGIVLAKVAYNDSFIGPSPRYFGSVVLAWGRFSSSRPRRITSYSTILTEHPLDVFSVKRNRCPANVSKSCASSENRSLCIAKGCLAQTKYEAFKLPPGKYIFYQRREFGNDGSITINFLPYKGGPDRRVFTFEVLQGKFSYIGDIVLDKNTFHLLNNFEGARRYASSYRGVTVPLVPNFASMWTP